MDAQCAEWGWWVLLPPSYASQSELQSDCGAPTGPFPFAFGEYPGIRGRSRPLRLNENYRTVFRRDFNKSWDTLTSKSTLSPSGILGAAKQGTKPGLRKTGKGKCLHLSTSLIEKHVSNFVLTLTWALHLLWIHNKEKQSTVLSLFEESIKNKLQSNIFPLWRTQPLRCS